MNDMKLFKGKYSVYRKRNDGTVRPVIMGNLKTTEQEGTITYHPDKNADQLTKTDDILYLNGYYAIMCDAEASL